MGIRPTLPCYHCNSQYTDSLHGGESWDTWYFYVECQDCGTRGKQFSKRSEAIEWWNLEVRKREE